MLKFSNNWKRLLKYLGFGVTAASLAARVEPVNKVIPYVVKQIKRVQELQFATSYFDGNIVDILVKNKREGASYKNRRK